MDDHTLQQVIDLAVKTAVLQAKKEAILECRPIGSYFITETEDDPNILFGGGWQKLTGRYVLQCSDENYKAGTVIEAGLPDITGNIHSADNGYYFAAGIGAEGCFSAYNPAPTIARIASEVWTGQRNNAFSFSASKSNPIYGRSDTVQPPARIVNVWKRVS